jgi:NADP-dependent 3-hydroxy acid dehydrogenase YdfG
MKERCGKIAFITGAASGIGKATTEKFLSDSSYRRIYAADINPKIYDIFNPKLHPKIIPLEFDVRSFRQIDETLEKIIDEAGKIDIEVNCAGTIAAGKARLNMGQDDESRTYLSMWQTNNYSVRHIIDKTAEIMKQNKGGTIIVVTSSKDHFPDPYRREYEYSKHDIEEYVLGHAKEHAKNNVKIVVVKPGNTKTDIDRGQWILPDSQAEMAIVQSFNDRWRNIFGNDPENVAEVISKIAEGRIKGSKIFVGLDAKLGRFLALTIPGWKSIFYLGSTSLYKIVANLEQPKKKLVNASHTLPISPSGEWFEEGLRREVAEKSSLDREIVKVGDTLYIRVVNSRRIDGNLQKMSFDYKMMDELGVKDEDLRDYYFSMNEKLGNKTMLLENCEPEPDGDWEYKYIANKVSESATIGRVNIIFKGKLIFEHIITVSKVSMPICK